MDMRWTWDGHGMGMGWTWDGHGMDMERNGMECDATWCNVPRDLFDHTAAVDLYLHPRRALPDQQRDDGRVRDEPRARPDRRELGAEPPSAAAANRD